MEFDEVVRRRRTIRRYTDQEVSIDTIRELIALALWAPSWGNTMPFELVAATGEALAQFKRENREALFAGQTACPDVPMPQTWPESMKKRYKNVGRRVLASQSIVREDHEGRLEYYGRMFSLFEAPALVFVTVDKEVLLEYAMLDVGLFLQTFCLAAYERGLGTCILAASVNYPVLARKIFSIPETKRLIMGVGLGWPDFGAPVNRFERERATVEEMVRWVS